MRECSFLEMPFPCFGEDLIFVALVRSGGYVGENQECGVYGGGFPLWRLVSKARFTANTSRFLDSE